MKLSTEEIKKYFWLSLSVLIVVSAIWTVYSIKPLEKYSHSLMPARTITVSGEGKVTAIPDIAAVSFSVVTEGADPVKIADESNKKAAAGINFVKEQGIEEKDIKTTAYNLSPRYEYNDKTRKTFISGYTLTQTVQIKIRDFSKIGEIMGALPELGINEIGTLSFGVDDDEKYLNEARKQAFEKAYAKAKDMAEQNRVHIERTVTFSESQNYPYPIYRETLGMAAASSAKVAQIEPGSQEITVNVSVTYEIE